MGFNTGGLYSEGIAAKVACPALGHLGAAGIASAEKQDIHWLRGPRQLLLKDSFTGKPDQAFLDSEK
jgi:hypothetical protein